MKQTVSEQALALVEKKITGLKGELTPQDAATATGITVGEARDALTRLMELYVTRVTADAEGNVLFAFEMPLRRRGTKTAAEKWAEVKGALWSGFKKFFKIWIGLMVIVYFAVMVILLLAIMIAQSSNDRDNRNRRRGGDDMINGLLRGLMEGLRFAFWTRALSPAGYAVDSYGYRYRRAAPPGGAKEKSFIIAIYDLALGPERVARDPLADEQEAAAFLRAERGIITPSEIVGLSGASMEQAEERMADYLVRFNGEPTITDEGAVVGEFESFIGGSSAKADAAITPYWDEYEAPYEHSGNSGGRNTAILAMVAFTMIVGIGLLAGGFNSLRIYGSFFRTGLAHFLLGYIPIAFSLVYFLVSGLRLGVVKKQESARLERNREKKVMRAIFQQRLWRATADQIYFSMVSLGEKELKKEQVTEILGRLLPKLQGELELGENGEGIYNFERVRREIEAAERLRARNRTGGIG
jgi:hypothetical protein